MSDNLRNEVIINIAGEERTMRATFTAMRGIEKTLGVSIIELNRKVARSDLGVIDNATIIYYGLRGNDDTRLSLEEVGEAVLTEGLTALINPVFDFVNAAMRGVKVGKPSPATEPV